MSPEVAGHCFPSEIWVFAVIDMGKKRLLVRKATLVEERDSPVAAEGPLLRHVYSLDHMNFIDSSRVPFADDAHVVCLPGLVLVPQGVIAPLQAVPFDVFARGLFHKEPQAPRAPTAPRARMGDAVRLRLLEEFPWITEEDLGRMQRAAPAGPGGGAAHARPDAAERRHERLADIELVEGAFAEVRERLQEVRDRWAGDDEDAEINFYMWIPGGVWTEVFRGEVADCAQYKGRAHTAFWCTLFQWPKSKRFHFSAHGEESCVQLAREWVSRSHHFFNLWLESGGALRDYDLVDHAPQVSGEFAEWSVSLPDASDTFRRVHELMNQWPVRRA